MINDLALGMRLAVGSGRISRSALLRLTMTVLGIAVATSVLLAAAAFGTALDKEHVRQAAAIPVSEPKSGVDPLLIGSWWFAFHGEYIVVETIAATGPTAPIPPDLDRLPAPGEVVVSPAVRQILDSSEGEALRNRLPGTVVATIDTAGVRSDDLTMYLGARPDQLNEYRYSEKVYGFGDRQAGADTRLTRQALLFLVPAAVVLLLPLLVFLTTAARVGAVQRERQLAALRLAGLDTRQVQRVAAGESLVGAVAGLVAGAGLFLLLRTQIGTIEILGLRFRGEDVLPPWLLALLIVVLIPVLTVGVALFGLRRTIIEPLAVVRTGTTKPRRMWWRWAIVILGGAVMASTLSAKKMSGPDPVIIALAGGSALLLIGVAAVLPWAVERLVRGMTGGAPSWQLAIRRLQVDSATSSRVVSALVVILAGAILIQTLVAGLTHRLGTSPWPVTLGSVSVQVDADAEVTEDVVRRIASTPGITQISTLHNANAKSSTGSGVLVEIGDCVALAVRATLPSCVDGDSFFVDNPRDQYRSPGYEYHPPTPTGVVQISSTSPSGSLQWAVPETLRHIPATAAAPYATGVLLLTPAALGDRAFLAGTRSAIYVGGQGTPDEVEDRVGVALRPIAWQVQIWNVGRHYGVEKNRNIREIRSLLLFPSMLVLALAMLNLLMLSVAQITERRRPLAAQSAAGVPIWVQAKALLWQITIPLGVGAILAIPIGLGIAAPILRITDLPITFDAGAIATLIAAALLAVLVATALTWPLLRSVTRFDNLHTE